MNIAGKGKKFFGTNHGDGLFSGCPSCFFKIEFFGNGNHKYIVFAGFAHGHQGFKYAIWVLVEEGGYFHTGEGPVSYTHLISQCASVGAKTRSVGASPTREMFGGTIAAVSYTHLMSYHV